MSTRLFRVIEVAGLFLRLGATAFGGPAAHIALLEDEVVRRRQWVSREAFLDYLGATNLIPGPNSTEMAIHLGYVRAGWVGLVAAGLCFIVPAALLVGLAAAAYVRYGTLPAMSALLYGVKPVVIAVVVQALWGLGRTALKRASLVGVAVLAGLAILAGVHELIVLAGAGLVAFVLPRPTFIRDGDLAGMAAPFSLPALSPAVGIASAAGAPFGLWPLFLVFAKIGAVLFGSGYVLLAFLRADLVVRLGWLTEHQLIDATAVGLITPGPVFTTATFIGYLLGGASGATVATVGIFLPAFVFVALSGPLVPRLRQSAGASAVLDGVNVASLALIAVVAWQLGAASLIDVTTFAIAVVSAALLMRRVNSTWLILGGAVAGLLFGSR
jgi:chromate transporter